jgi:tetratricopeptide (TPR) repeat protein
VNPRHEKPKVVPFERGRRGLDPVRVREFAVTARRLQREREESAGVVDKLLRETPRAEWPRLVEHPALRNSGALERLSVRITECVDRDPHEAVDLSALATTIAETLRAGDYPPVVHAQIRANAWKDRAHTLQFLGRYSEATQAIERGESILAPFATAAHDRAILLFVKALILQRLEEFDDSAEILDRCRAVFFDHGDTKRYLSCGVLRANLLYRMERYAEARESYAMLLDVADAETRARLQNNLALCAIQLGDLASADAHVQEASRGFRDVDRDVEGIRVEAIAGRLLLARGFGVKSMEMLAAARAQFREYNMIEESGLCALGMAEALLTLGRNDDAEAIAASVAEEFESAQLNHRSIDAVRRLRDEIEAKQATVQRIQAICAYVEALRIDPTRQLTM